MTLKTRQLANIASDLNATWHVAHRSNERRTIEVIAAEMDGVCSRARLAQGDADEMARLRVRAGELRAEMATLIALADEAAGVYEEGE